MVAGFKSESRSASLRNTWPECLGICTLTDNPFEVNVNFFSFKLA
jgi:hypothetical protein